MTELMNDPTSTESSQQMLAMALAAIDRGNDPQQLIDVAIEQIDYWARLAEDYAAGNPSAGLANSYTGETYAEARVRWESYRDLLLEHLRGPDGAWH